MREIIEANKKTAVQGMDMFLRNFSHVPDDKLNWCVTPTAKSPLRIAAHTALYASIFAKMIRSKELPKVENLDTWLEERNAAESAIFDRLEIERIFREGTDDVLAALDSLSDEDVDLVLDSGMGWTMSMRFLMGLPGWHATLHTGQIDFLQTCWDDQQIYVS